VWFFPCAVHFPPHCVAGYRQKALLVCDMVLSCPGDRSTTSLLVPLHLALALTITTTLFNCRQLPRQLDGTKEIGGGHLDFVCERVCKLPCHTPMSTLQVRSGRLTRLCPQRVGSGRVGPRLRLSPFEDSPTPNIQFKLVVMIHGMMSLTFLATSVRSPHISETHAPHCYSKGL
jgi:hypothetical protein